MRTKKPWRPGRLEDAAQIVDARRAIDAGAELRQLERDVPLDPRRDNDLEEPDVLARRARRPPPAVRTLSPR